MVIENMRFTQLPDDKIDVVFQCHDCGKFMHYPEHAFKRQGYNPFVYMFLCHGCWDERKAKWEMEKQERLQNRTRWQKFKDFLF